MWRRRCGRRWFGVSRRWCWQGMRWAYCERRRRRRETWRLCLVAGRLLRLLQGPWRRCVRVGVEGVTACVHGVGCGVVGVILIVHVEVPGVGELVDGRGDMGVARLGKPLYESVEAGVWGMRRGGGCCVGGFRPPLVRLPVVPGSVGRGRTCGSSVRRGLGSGCRASRGGRVLCVARRRRFGCACVVGVSPLWLWMLC